LIVSGDVNNHARRRPQRLMSWLEPLACDGVHSNAELTDVGLSEANCWEEIMLKMTIRLVAFFGLTAASSALMALPYLTIN
jgi:hypothetical protein